MAVNALVQWGKQWQLPLSPNKTVCMTLAVVCRRTYVIILFDNFRVAAARSVKDLGLHYEAKFSLNM